MRTAEYVASHFGNMYDFFFIVRDNTYVRGYRLKELAEDLSVSTDVLLGARHQDSCRLDGGLLLSRQLLVNTERKAECEARLQTSALTGDQALISCLELLGGIRCTDRAQGKWFVSQEAHLYDPSAEGDLPGLVSIQAVHSAADHNRLHAAFSRLEIAEIDERIGQLRRALEDNQRNLHVLSRAKAGDDSKEESGEPEPLPWPTGSPAPVRTASRHHINMWERFSETEMFLRSEQQVVDPHTEVDRLDIQDVMELGMAELRKTAPVQLVKLRAGYRRFDGTRGMDYILDMEVQPDSGGATQTRRVEVHRPILKAELVPIPFVTEKPTVSILLSVQPHHVDRAHTFVQELINKNENVALMLFLVPGEADTSLFEPLRRLVKQANERRSAAAHRFEAVVWPHREPPSQFDMVDTVGEQTRGRWQQALVLLLSEPVEFNSELLNRARMQTIRGWEVFCPIPWVEYYPAVGYYGTTNLRPDKLELRKDYGHFDGEHYAIMSFYMDDYKIVREQTLDSIPMGVPRVGGSSSRLPYDLYGAFVKFSGLHVHRAVDPSFRLFYFERSCPAPALYFYQKACESSQMHGLGPHDKLSRLLADFRLMQGEDSRHVNAI
ncbi:chondroitin sulfate synthase 2-like [Amphibalanus amphitrite]|uniref:chondroitin sulfate synthase 2-like n=1 Tax=Amphibalanus amphitrite TaxID=1232801 RepID=UPI001C91932C|nr:chondroitin sulfate synthase 2-like [Amphibalanus amphitrite]